MRVGDCLVEHGWLQGKVDSGEIAAFAKESARRGQGGRETCEWCNGVSRGAMHAALYSVVVGKCPQLTPQAGGAAAILPCMLLRACRGTQRRGCGRYLRADDDLKRVVSWVTSPREFGGAGLILLRGSICGDKCREMRGEGKRVKWAEGGLGVGAWGVGAWEEGA